MELAAGPDRYDRNRVASVRACSPRGGRHLWPRRDCGLEERSPATSPGRASPTPGSEAAMGKSQPLHPESTVGIDTD